MCCRRHACGGVRNDGRLWNYYTSGEYTRFDHNNQLTVLGKTYFYYIYYPKDGLGNKILVSAYWIFHSAPTFANCLASIEGCSEVDHPC